MTTLTKRLDKHFAAAAVAVAAGLAATTAQASIVYSGPVNINVPDNIDGTYMNVVTGAAAAIPPAGWDINPYSALAGGLYLWGPTANTWFSTNGGTQFVLTPGTTIGGAAASFFRPGGGLDIAPQLTLNSSNNLLGFRFVNEAAGNQVQFGWVRFNVGANAGVRSIVEYAYENTGASINAGAVPAPGALALLGLAGLVSGRRRRA